MSPEKPPLASDTIAAIATAVGRAGIGVLRISGSRAQEIARVLAIDLPAPRHTGLRRFRDREGRVIDEGLVIHFPAPHSFTGEDVVELQAHGSPVALNALLTAACTSGARRARPGEFSERAFLNGRMDLAQAEAIADLIDAGSEAAARAAARTLQGEFSHRVAQTVESLTALRVLLEAALDFADEDVPAAAPEQIRPRLALILEELAAVQRAAAQGRRLRDGMTVAIAGRPNVGKSTLLNRLAGGDAAIVSPQAGTTRDVLREHIVIDGLPLTVIDTAGLRETDDPVEREGVRRARVEVAQAELVLLLVDDRDETAAHDADSLRALAGTETAATILVRNKCDLSGAPAGPFEIGSAAATCVRISAETGAGIDALVGALKQRAGLSEETGRVYSARARHLEALRLAQTHVEAAAGLCQARLDPVLMAEEMRLAQHALGEITGEVSSEDLLGKIFSSFCLGK